MSLMTLVNVVRATVPYEWENYSRDRAWRREGRRFQSALGEVLNRDGVASVDRYLDPRRCDGIREQIELAIEGVAVSGRHATGAEIDVRRPNDGREPYDTGMIDIRHVDRIVPEIQEIFADPLMLEAIAEACGQPVRCQNCNALVNRAVVNPRSYHSDSTGIVQFKAFIYLTDVPDPSYGPYCYVKGTHRLRWDKYANFANNWWTGRPITDMRTHDETQEVRMIAPRGTLILSNQNGFHRGWPQQLGRRRCMILGNYVAA